MAVGQHTRRTQPQIPSVSADPELGESVSSRCAFRVTAHQPLETVGKLCTADQRTKCTGSGIVQPKLLILNCQYRCKSIRAAESGNHRAVHNAQYHQSNSSKTAEKFPAGMTMKSAIMKLMPSWGSDLNLELGASPRGGPAPI